MRAEAAGFAGKAYTIHFNGYCDGMRFAAAAAVPDSMKIAVGQHLNDDCAGGTDHVMGAVNRNEYLLVGEAASNYSSYQIGYGIHKPIVDGGTFDLWVCFSGSTCFEGASGTYCLGCCAERGGDRPIRARVAELIAARKAASH